MRTILLILLAWVFTGCQQKEVDDALNRVVAAEKESAALKGKIDELEKQVAALSATDAAAFGRATDADQANNLEAATRLYGEVQQKFGALSLSELAVGRQPRLKISR